MKRELKRKKNVYQKNINQTILEEEKIKAKKEKYEKEWKEENKPNAIDLEINEKENLKKDIENW